MPLSYSEEGAKYYALIGDEIESFFSVYNAGSRMKKEFSTLQPSNSDHTPIVEKLLEEITAVWLSVPHGNTVVTRVTQAFEVKEANSMTMNEKRYMKLWSLLNISSCVMQTWQKDALG